MRVPTVRVKHPVLGFVTINAADFGAQHELHDEQAEGFDPAHLPRALVGPLDPALRDAAADLGLRMAAFRRRTAGEPFADLPPAEQLLVVRALSAELDAGVETYEAREQERRAREAAQTERGDQSWSAQAVPALAVSKGPGGRWYVMRGDERVSRGFADPAAAEAERIRLSSGVEA